MACGILVPWSGIEPGPSAVKVWSPNHWTAKEFPIIPHLKKKKDYPNKRMDGDH